MSIAIDRQRKAVAQHLSFCFRSPVVLGPCVVAAAFTAGWATGSLRPDAVSSKLAYTAGACIALEMAEAHLMIEHRAKATVTEALVGPLNPYRALFPDRRSEVLAVCHDVRARRRTFVD